MKLSPRHWIAVPVACLLLGVACNRQTGLPAADAARSTDAQKLPFDRPSQSAGLSPSRSLIPSGRRLPEGTPLTICLQRDLSSASARPGDTFTAALDAPIVIDGQRLVARGAAVSGRVLEAKRSSGPHDPGYLRLALVSLTVGERTIPIATSSLFAKGGAHEQRTSAMIGAGADHGSSTSFTTEPAPSVPKEILLGPERRLSFRLAQNVDLQ